MKNKLTKYQNQLRRIENDKKDLLKQEKKAKKEKKKCLDEEIKKIRFFGFPVQIKPIIPKISNSQILRPRFHSPLKKENLKKDKIQNNSNLVPKLKYPIKNHTSYFHTNYFNRDKGVKIIENKPLINIQSGNVNLEIPIVFNDKTIIIVQIGDKYGVKNQDGKYIHELEYDFVGREIHNSKDGFYILGRKNGDVFQDKLYLK